MHCIQLHGLVPVGTGLSGAAPPHEILPCGPINALISTISRPVTPDDLTPEEIADLAMRHNAILMAYCDQTTVVPMALGSVFSRKAAVVSELTIHLDKHVQNLNLLDDIREYTVQLKIVGAPKTDPVTANSGREYLQMQRAQRTARGNLHRDRHVFAQKALDQLQTPIVQVEVSTSPKPDHLFNCVVLLKKANVVHLQQMARDLHVPAEALGLDLIITGPWPPYSSAALKVPANHTVCDVI